MSKSILQHLYYSDKNLTLSDYEQSRRMFIFEGATAVSIFSLTTGAYLAGFGKYLGASDSVNGIIGALPVLTCVIQMFSSMVFEKLPHRKFLICISCFLFRFLLGLMFFIPLMNLGKTANITLVILIYGLAYSISAIISPPAANWLVNLTPINIRGKYLARKDAISLAFSTIITICLGKILDILRNNNNEKIGFLVVGISVIVLAVANFVSLSKVKEQKNLINSGKIDLKLSLVEPLRNITFRKVIYLSIFWNIALQIGGPFFSIYMVTGLKLSYSYIMVLGLIASVVRIFVAKYWGKMADNKSWTFTTKISLVVLALCHFLWMLASGPIIYFLLPIIHVIAGVAWSGLAISMFNLQFMFSPIEGRMMYLGMNASIGGIVGFITTLFASYLVNIFEGTHFYLLGISIGNVQMLFGLSSVLLVGCFLYVHKFMNYEQVDHSVPHLVNCDL